MTFRSISLILMILISAIGCFAQTTYEEQRQMDEDKERLEKLKEQYYESQKPEFADFVASYLPEEKGAWTISISQSGGILGKSAKLVGLINSQGTVACNDGKRLLAEDSLKEMSEFIQTNDFKNLRKAFEPNPSFCRDCYVTTLTLAYRPKKSKMKIYNYSFISLPESSPEIKQFYEKAKDYTACQ